MIKNIETIKVGECFTTTPQNEYAMPFAGTVAKVEQAGNYILITTTTGGWHRIHKGQTVATFPNLIKF